jgi:hypothetical protein
MKTKGNCPTTFFSSAENMYSMSILKAEGKWRLYNGELGVGF